MTVFKVAAFRVHSSMAQMFSVSNSDIKPSLDELFEGGFSEQEYSQRFAWFPGAINFFPCGSSGEYWIEVSKSDSYMLEEDSDFAVLLPFTVSKMNTIQISGTDDLEAQAVPIERGMYQLVYQERYLTQPEIDSIPVELGSVDPEPNLWLRLGPKICKLTFIPTSIEFEPEILKAPEGRTIKPPLLLRR